MYNTQQLLSTCTQLHPITSCVCVLVGWSWIHLLVYLGRQFVYLFINKYVIFRPPYFELTCTLVLIKPHSCYCINESKYVIAQSLHFTRSTPGPCRAPLPPHVCLQLRHTSRLPVSGSGLLSEMAAFLRARKYVRCVVRFSDREL